VLYVLAYLNLEPTGYTANAALAIACIYVLDFLVFEHQLLTTFEVQTEGFGLVSTLGYALFPLCAMIMPLYVITAK